MNHFLPPLRPPAALTEERFLKLCVRCGQCVTVCPHKCISLRAGFGRSRHTPEIIPSKIPCYLCMKCPPACPTGALDASRTEPAEAGMGQAYISTERCYNFTNQTMCMTCYDRCPLRGTAVVLQYGLNPAMTKACVGCGICAYVCPAKAITIVPKASSWQPPLAQAPLAQPS